MQNQTLPRLNDPARQQDLFDAPIAASPSLDTDFGLAEHLANYGYKSIDQADFLLALNRADSGKRSYLYFGSKIADVTKANLLHNESDKFCNHSVELSRESTVRNFKKAIEKLTNHSTSSTHQYVSLNTAYRGGPGGRKEGNTSVISWYSIDFDLPSKYVVRACRVTNHLHLLDKKTHSFVGIYDPVAAVEEIRCAIEACGLPQPHFIVFTGNGFQAHWRVSPKNGRPIEVKNRRDALGEMQSRIADALPNDSLLKVDRCAIDALRYLRLPGSIHGRTGQQSRAFHNEFILSEYDADEFQRSLGVTPTGSKFDARPHKRRRKKVTKKPDVQPDFELVISTAMPAEEVKIDLEWHGLVNRYKAHNKRVYEHFKEHAVDVKEGSRHSILLIFATYSMLHHNNADRAGREVLAINDQLEEPLNRAALLKSLKGAIDERGYRYRRQTLDEALADAGLPLLPWVSTWSPLSDHERVERQRKGQRKGCETKINETLEALLKAVEKHGLDNKEAVARSAKRCLATVYKYADQLAEILADRILAKASSDKGLRASVANFYLTFSKGSVCVCGASIARLAADERDAFEASLEGHSRYSHERLSRTRRSRQNRTEILSQVPEIRAEIESLGVDSKPLARLLHALVYERLFALLSKK